MIRLALGIVSVAILTVLGVVMAVIGALRAIVHRFVR